jgi:primosomal protein N' (replication factor Y)
LYVKVAVPRPIDALFDYEYDVAALGPVEAGDWVRVPFGNSKLNACVIGAFGEAPVLPEGVKAKPVIERLDSVFRLPEEVLALCRFGSEYYQYPIGEALFAAAPPKPDQILSARASKSKGKAPDLSRLDRKLSEDQTRVFEEIRAQCESRPDSAFLLEGVTGSGKTEVYIELARDVLARGKSVLILVPEISLTAQLRDRFQSSLPERVALWHSALSDGVRQTQWRQVKEGKIRVVIGARSALFAPFGDLGLIVVDEEHDSTYKQEERFRYQARDLAMFRAKQRRIPIVLGSATPSLESIQRVRDGRLIPLKLKSRYSKSTLPAIHTVSLIDEPPVGAGTVRTPLAPTTVRAMQAAIDRGEQVMIFLNRRGYAQFLLCQACGWVQKCVQCSISMTLYQKRGELRCHVCASRARVPSHCGECGSGEVFGMGSGTESLEDDLAMVLNGAKILRLDRDQITSQKRLEETLDEFRSLRSNVLIGTQMLVKGHDFPKVTCVVVVSVDSLLKWPDFRASERALQTLIQVSGRAGRAELPGNVYLQGYDLEHPVVRVVQGLLSHEEFVQEELSMREALSYPPFSRLVRFRFDHEAEDPCREFALEVAGSVRTMLESAKGGAEHRVLGPSEALLFRAQNRYRFDLYFKAPSLELLYRVSKGVRAVAAGRGMNVVVDVDPYNS